MAHTRDTLAPLASGAGALPCLHDDLRAGRGPVRLGEHTQYNHYALLADAWLHGRQDLVNGPPRYTGNNDFASFHGKTYITFPPFPAVLMVPLVAASGSAENFRDGQFVIWLAGLAPALMFLVLEKLRRTGRSNRSETESVLLAALMAIGTVYFFTAVEGTVWFAALVINVALMALYALFALDAESPALAGVMLGLIFATRVTPILAAPLFALEAIRVSCAEGLPAEGVFVDRVRLTWTRVDNTPCFRGTSALPSRFWPYSPCAPGRTTRDSTAGTPPTSATST